VIRSGEFLYRLIFAARALTDDADARFMDSIRSFRRLAPDEGADARPLRIAVAVAGPGDTIETMAARMVVPNRPAEYFMLLNGLSAGDSLVPGEHYKIVTD
jgi:predicted Zn-dependent protease